MEFLETKHLNFESIVHANNIMVRSEREKVGVYILKKTRMRHE